MIRASISGLAMLPAALAPPASAAEGYATTAGWTVIKDVDGCAMFMEYGGPGSTHLLLSKYTDGKLMMAVSNANWSARDDAEYSVSYILNDVSFSGGTDFGYRSDGHAGFISTLPPKFEQHFAAGSSLHIFLGDQQIDRLSLAGTTAALASVNRCLSSVRREKAAAERERQRWEDLPADPFAGAPTIRVVPTIRAAPVPRGNPGDWSTTNDYPSRALREERSGTTGFHLKIDGTGKVTSCTITKSSGSPDLDGATCDNVMRRAHFDPATDAKGIPIDGEYSSSVHWVLPRD